MTSPNPDLPPVHTAERAGIPLLWSPAEGDARAALVFRVGQFDEPYARGGITHLVEHLVFDGLGDPAYTANAFVGLEATAFTARGSVDEVTGFLDHVVRALADLPTERLELERAVLEAEAAAQEPTVDDFLGLLRWGLTAPGRRGAIELALRTADEQAVKAWARARFTRGAAALCWIGPEPPQFDWRLPDGVPQRLPSDVALATPAPFALAGDDGGVAMSMTTPGGLSTAVFADLLEHRLLHELRQERALVYHVDAHARDILPGLAEVVVKTAATTPQAAAQIQPVFLDELDRLARNHVDATELAAAVRRIRERVLDPDDLSTHLLDRALALIAGRPVPTLEADLATLEAIDAATIADLADDARDTILLLAPETVVPPAWFITPETAPQPEPFTGTVFRTRGLRSSRRAELTLGDKGFTLRLPDEGVLSIAWTDIVAATREADGEFYLTGQDGTFGVVDPSTFKGDTDEIVRFIESKLDPATIVPSPGAERTAVVQAAAERDLKKPSKLKHALAALAAALEPGEEIRQLSSALAGAMRWGVLAVTDRRTLFVMSFDDDDADIAEYRHARLRGVRVEDSMKGKVLILDVGPEPQKYWGFDRQSEAGELRDHLEAALAD